MFMFYFGSYLTVFCFHQLEKTKKRNDYANYVRTRNSQILTTEINLKDNNRKSFPVNNRLVPLEQNKRVKVK
jgi:hypothetical protein